MVIPPTQVCPQCEADMELITTDDEGEIVVYECPDCGFQAEHRIPDDEAEDGHEGGADDAGPEDASTEAAVEDGDEADAFEPDDAS